MRCLGALLPVGAEIMIGPGNEPILRKDDLLYEVVVTDDGTQSTAEALVREGYPWARWFPGPKRGPGANRNFGVTKASGEWLVFLDDDCFPAAGWLEAYASAATDFQEFTVLEGRTIPKGLQTGADQECPSNLQGGRLWSNNFAIKRQLFLEMEGFDEKFSFSMEDVDFLVRLEKMGCPIKFVPGASVEHRWRSKRGTSFCIALAESIRYFTEKHPETRQGFAKAWGIRRMIKIVVIEFPRNLLRYRDIGSVRVLYLDLLTAAHITLALGRSPKSSIIQGGESHRKSKEVAG